MMTRKIKKEYNVFRWRVSDTFKPQRAGIVCPFCRSFCDVPPVFLIKILLVSTVNVYVYRDSVYEYSSSMFWLSHSTTELSGVSITL